MTRPLLDCPFCGGIPSLFNDDNTENGWAADCMHCGCAGFTGTRDFVIGKWNRRAPTLEATLAGLQPLLDQAAIFDKHRHRRREEGT